MILSEPKIVSTSQWPAVIIKTMRLRRKSIFSLLLILTLTNFDLCRIFLLFLRKYLYNLPPLFLYLPRYKGNGLLANCMPNSLQIIFLVICLGLLQSQLVIKMQLLSWVEVCHYWFLLRIAVVSDRALDNVSARSAIRI